MRKRLFLLLFSVIVSGFLKPAFAGPPFLTDDPEPVPFRNWEFYVFSTYDTTGKDTSATGPAFEFNVGALPDLQAHLVIPMVYAAPEDGPREYGLGDTEVGIKYRFVHETTRWPQVAVFPMIELPTGDADRGLGNGRTWWRLPLWLQKSWGPWVTYGGGGYVVNPAPGANNYVFGGWLLQRDFGDKLTLGGEVFSQGRSSDDSESFTVFNLGGFFKITPNLHLLFTGGHTLVGGTHTIGYLGLYWTGELGKGTRIHTGEKGEKRRTFMGGKNE